MATPAHRLVQDQNLNFLYSGTTPAGKTDVAKADKRGGFGVRKALNDISNSRKPSSVLQSVKKDNSINVIAIEKDPNAVKAKLSKKEKAGSRKALRDLTNSTKPPTQQVPSTGRKLNAVAEGNVPSCVMEERYLHNHEECIKAQMKGVDVDYFLKSVGLSNDIAVVPSASRALPLSSKNKLDNTTCMNMEEMPEHLFEDEVFQCKKSEFPSYYSPACRSPQSPKAPFMSWEDDDSYDFAVVESPKPV